MPPLPLYRLEYRNDPGPGANYNDWCPSGHFPRTDYSGREVEAILTSPACRSMDYRLVQTNASPKTYEVVLTRRVVALSAGAAREEVLACLPGSMRNLPVSSGLAGPSWTSIETKEVPNANHSG